MRTTTKERLWELLSSLQAERAVLDPQWKGLEQEYDTLYGHFMERHHHNKALRAEVLKLVDSSVAFWDYRGEVQFFLGLQLGLELGGLDVLDL